MRTCALLMGLLSSLTWAEPPAGGGGLPQPATDELSLAQRGRIDEQLARNVDDLQHAGQASYVRGLAERAKSERARTERARRS